MRKDIDKRTRTENSQVIDVYKWFFLFFFFFPFLGLCATKDSYELLYEKSCTSLTNRSCRSYKTVSERSVINNSRSSSRFPAATECYTQLVVFKFYDSELVHIVYIRF